MLLRLILYVLVKTVSKLRCGKYIEVFFMPNLECKIPIFLHISVSYGLRFDCMGTDGVRIKQQCIRTHEL